MPIEPLVITSTRGIALSDEQREQIVSADYAENVDFSGQAMISGMPDDVTKRTDMPSGVITAIQYDANSILTISSEHDSTVGANVGVITKVPLDGSAKTELARSENYNTALPSLAYMLRAWRIGTSSGRNLWFDGTTVQDAQLDRPTLSSVASGVVLSTVYRVIVESIVTDLIATGAYTLTITVSLSGDDALRQYIDSVRQSGSLVTLEFDNYIEGLNQTDNYRISTVTYNSTSGEVIVQLVKDVVANPVSPTTLLNATLTLPSVATKGITGTAFYAVSYEYDGFQEGPLSAPGKIAISDATAKLDVTVNLTANTLQRITGINIYRALAYTPDAAAPETPYYHIGYVSGNTTTATVEDTLSELLDTYMDRTGIPSTLTTMDLQYSLVATDGIYLYAANCRLGTQDYSTYVFRSKPYRPDMFDWTSDFIRLQEKPTAMVYSFGKVFVWTEATLYVLSTDLVLLDSFPGLGVSSQKNVTTWSQGVAWFSQNGFWIYDGANLSNIGRAIRKLPAHGGSMPTADSYEIGDTSPSGSIVYRPDVDGIMLYGNTESGGSWGWLYSIPERSISIMKFAHGLPDAVIQGWAGKTYAIAGTTLYSVADATTYRGYIWRSVDLARGIRTRLYEFIIEFSKASNNSITINVYYDDGTGLNVSSYTVTPSISGEVYRHRLAAPVKGRSLFFEIVDTNGTNHIRGITLRRRALRR